MKLLSYISAAWTQDSVFEVIHSNPVFVVILSLLVLGVLILFKTIFNNKFSNQH